MAVHVLASSEGYIGTAYGRADVTRPFAEAVVDVTSCSVAQHPSLEFPFKAMIKLDPSRPLELAALPALFLVQF